MNKVMTLLMILVANSFAIAQGQLHVTFKNFNGERGSVLVGLFIMNAIFLRKAIQGKTVEVTADVVTLVFENLEPGDYAVSVIHYRNNNGKLDTNRLGIPDDGFAFGNNCMGIFGPQPLTKPRSAS